MNQRTVLSVLCLLAACQGNGSDLGPSLPPLPGPSAKVQVLDDEGRGVCGAQVFVGGARAATGRQGRGDLFASINGPQRLTVDAAAASATASDLLVGLVCTVAMTGGDVPTVVYLPNVGASNVLVVNGSVPVNTQLNDLGNSGATLNLSAGTLVSFVAPSVTLRLARLAARHIPGELPVATSGAYLFSSGYLVDPLAVSFLPSATLEVENELGLPVPPAVAEVYKLDRISGSWSRNGSASVNVAGRLVFDTIDSGGLYVAAFAVPLVSTIQGLAVGGQNLSVGATFVAADGARAIGSNAGSFTLQPIAATLADGTPRRVTIELRGSGSWLPTKGLIETGVLVAGTTTNVGNVLVDTVPVANYRVLAIERARIEPLLRVGWGSELALTGSVSILNAQGTYTFEDIGLGNYGFSAAHPYDSNDLFYCRNSGSADLGTRWFDVDVFFGKVGWHLGGDNTLAYVSDQVSSCPAINAGLVQGTVDGQGLIGFVNQTGMLVVNRNFSGSATGSQQTRIASRSITSAITFMSPNCDSLELPVRRSLHPSIGNFDRNGMVRGNLTGFLPSSEQRLRASRLLVMDDWVGEVLIDEPIISRYPVKVGASVEPGKFMVGIASPMGNVAVAEGTDLGGHFTLAAVGILAGLAVPEAVVTPRDLPIDRPANTDFVAQTALAGLDPSFTIADLSFDLALLQPSAFVVDVARNIGGNLSRTGTGTDLRLRLPNLTGALVGSSWLTALHAEAHDATTATTQRLLLSLAIGATPARSFLPLPLLTAPVNGAVVLASGFDVGFSLPAAAMYATLDLRSEAPTNLVDELRWEVVVPPGTTAFRFWLLPSNVAKPLVAGRTYTLTLTAFAAQGGLREFNGSPYTDTIQFWQTIGIGTRGVTAVSSQKITITAN
ncbi:hypothetical protein LBMAG49_15690 [Planctomycetota bacterium]|nr:hypothetical protein LBMAG49_15690 [Planctomycetota bacterium]